MERRVLFIDDDRAGREVALFNLRKAGYKVEAASDGTEGLALFSQGKFDLVITDLKMPGISGMEGLRRIRARGVERDVVSVSPAMKRVLEMADRVARTEATVLITGESGTGKEAVARRIHVRSPRAA